MKGGRNVADKSIADEPVPNGEHKMDSFASVLQPDPAIINKVTVDEAEEQPEKVYDFDEQAKVSKEAEEWFIRFARRWKEQNIISDFYDVREDAHYQNADIDFICVMPDGRRHTYEVKGDFKNTGNLFAEYAVPSYVIDANDRLKINDRHAKLGWLYRSKAEYVFYYYSQRKAIYLFELSYFAAWVDRMSLNCFFMKRRQKKPFEIRGAKNLDNKNDPYGSYYYGMGYLVPLREIEDTYQKRYFLKVYHIKYDAREEQKNAQPTEKSETDSVNSENSTPST